MRHFVTRIKRYENIDGTGEMVVGLVLLGYFLAGYLVALLPENTATWVRVVVIYASLALAVVLAYWARRAIKRRITWPRTGYVAYRRSGKVWWGKLAIACLNVLAFVTVVTLLIRRGHVMSAWNLSPKTWNPRVVLLVVISTVAYGIWIPRGGGEHRWKWLVLILMILGIITFALLVPGDFGQWARPPILFIAFLWLCSAVGTLYSYIHHTKAVHWKAE